MKSSFDSKDEQEKKVEELKLDADQGGGGMHGTTVFLFLIVVSALMVSIFSKSGQIPYSEFLSAVDKGQVKRVLVDDNRISGEIVDEKSKTGKRMFVTTRIDPELASELSSHGIEFDGVQNDDWLFTALLWVIGGLVFFSFIGSLMKNAASGRGFGPGTGMTIGKSNARIYVEETLNTTFDDVAGVDEAKEELKEIVSFLTEPEKYKKLGAKLPKGIILVGPPGTGKTLLARALAGEAGVPFLSINGSEFVEMFVGVGAARVRDLFKQAQSYAPCLVFIDELDALGKSRGVNPLTGSNDEKEQTLNQLLSELDGFDPKGEVILVAATNRPEILDPALLRSGRFDRQVVVDRPDKRGRKAILEVHTRTVKCTDNLDLTRIASVTPGFSGADLANLVNEAALLAARAGENEVSDRFFMLALERIIGGLERKNRILSPFEREVVAYHEIGHALVSLALPGCDKFQKVSIIPRGVGALGYTLNQPDEDRYIMSGAELRNRLVGLMGGRAAEELKFGHLSTGAADDFEKATDLARSMVTKYGMNERMGMVVYEKQGSLFLGSAGNSESMFNRRYSEQTAREIDCEVRSLLASAHSSALRVLRANREHLTIAAKILLDRETLNRKELLEAIPEIVVPGQLDFASRDVNGGSSLEEELGQGKTAGGGNGRIYKSDNCSPCDSNE